MIPIQKQMTIVRFIFSTIIGISICGCTASLPAEPTSPAQLARLVVHYPIGGSRAVVGVNDGSTPQFQAYTIDSDDVWARVTSEATWSSSDTVGLSPSTITPGLFGYRTPGSYVIYATYRGLQAALPIDVRAVPPFPYLELGNFQNRISPTLRFAAGSGNAQSLLSTQVTWSSSDERVAKVDTAGTFMAVAPGNVRIFATRDGLSDFYWRSVAPRGQ